MKRIAQFVGWMTIATIGLAACGSQPEPTPEEPELVAVIVTPPTLTVTPSITPTVTFTPLPPLTPTPLPLPTYDPGEAGPPYERGNRAFAEGDYAVAINEYTQAIRLRDDFADAYYNRGLSYAAVGDVDEALDDLGRAIDLQPFRADAHVARARVYRDAENTQAALRDLNEALAKNPEYAPAYLERGAIYEERGDLETALSDYTVFTSVAAANPQGFYHRGRVLLELGDAEAALIDLTLSVCLQESERVECQGQLLDTTLAPDFFIEFELALFERGKAYAALNQHSFAATDFEDAITRGLETSELFRQLGLTYFQLDQLESAGGSLVRAVELDPDSFAARYSLAFLYNEIGEYYLSTLSATDALGLDPSSVEAFMLRGNAWLNNQNYDQALDDFETAYDLDPDYALALLGSAQARTGLQDYEEALVDVRLYLQETTPEDPNYQRGIDLLNTLETVTGE